ncbi:unnamed protein product [Musa acuminata subsp. malaccensis]|uniref:(wild Malaysian banana) hypothetical protein n=1 Tax=Musa acuminata subsp. malaccensis TaxID=214687 RepID=A0A804KPA3_MUSAM|nr:unnamed protein product [Musa acuminata subsp. malaccensis]
MAQWIRRWSTEPEILGSIPSGVEVFAANRDGLKRSRNPNFEPIGCSNLWHIMTSGASQINDERRAASGCGFSTRWIDSFYICWDHTCVCHIHSIVQSLGCMKCFLKLYLSIDCYILSSIFGIYMLEATSILSSFFYFTCERMNLFDI